MLRPLLPWCALVVGLVACDSVIGADDFGPDPATSPSSGGATVTDSDNPDGGSSDGGGGGGGAPGATTTVEWVRTFGAQAADRLTGLVVHPDRHAVVVAGEMGAEIVIGADPVSSHGEQDVLVVELDAAGLPTWSRALGGPGTETAEDIALAPEGHVVVVGNYQGAPDFGTGTLPAAQQTSAFVVQLDGTTGATRWALGIGASNDLQGARGVAVAPNGDIVLVGEARGTVVAGALSADCGTTQPHALIARIDAAGSPVWLRCATGAGEHAVRDVAVDSVGRALVGGEYTGGLSLDGSELASATRAGFLLQLTATGNPIWERSYSSADGVAIGAVAVGPADQVLFAGGFYGAVDLGGDDLGADESPGMFLGALDDSGAHQWSMWWPAGTRTTLAAPHCLATDPTGQILIAGDFTAQANLGWGPVESHGGADGFLMRLRADRSVAWGFSVGRNDEDALRGCAFDGAAAVLAAGFFGGNIQFDGTLLSSGGEADGLLVRLSPP